MTLGRVVRSAIAVFVGFCTVNFSLEFLSTQADWAYATKLSFLQFCTLAALIAALALNKNRGDD